MGTGKKEQKKVQLPPNWWWTVYDLCLSKWQHDNNYLDIYKFLDISKTTIETVRGAKKNRMTEKLFGKLASKMGYEKRDDLLKVLNSASASASVNNSYPIIVDGAEESFLGKAPEPMTRPHAEPDENITLSNAGGRLQRVGPDLDDSTRVGSAEERILFYMADRELHENSCIPWERHSQQAWLECLGLELRLIFLTMNIDGEIVLPPTYYLETSLCRDLIDMHMPLVEAGYIKLLLNQPSLTDYLKNKQQRYAKARHFPAYFDAYFADRDFHGLGALPFQFTDKKISVGKETLSSWRHSLLGKIEEHPRFVNRARSFLELSASTERSAILYENICENQITAGLTNEEMAHLDVRTTMNQHYLQNYHQLGFILPERSLFVWSGLTRELPRSGMDLVALARLVTEYDLRSRMMNADAKTLIHWRSKPAVRAFFVACRQHLFEDKSLSVLVSSNQWEKLLQEINAALS